MVLTNGIPFSVGRTPGKLFPAFSFSPAWEKGLGWVERSRRWKPLLSKNGTFLTGFVDLPPYVEGEAVEKSCPLPDKGLLFHLRDGTIKIM